jgi:pimeloyl-ACP methyl ester carboxylesterase
MSPDFEPVVGRYLRLDIDGAPHRIFVEEAGAGVPLLCLHTAGADTRQWRGLLNDDEVLKDFRVVAFDLPRHGKSSPPVGYQRDDYRLETQSYLDTVIAIAEALDLERPIVMGCSIGGRLVLHLALRYPDRLGGVIGLQAGAHVDPYYDVDWLHRPDVHGGEVCAGVVSGLIGPAAPEGERWETLWHYMQSGPGIFKGDLWFYKVGGDIRDQLGEIDTNRCPVFLLTGEYDYSCTPDDSRVVADAVTGALLEVMPGLGHFPMSEDYARFRTHLLPILSTALERRGR